MRVPVVAVAMPLVQLTESKNSRGHGDGRARYEAAAEAHHDHLINVETGEVIEFVDPELEALQKVIAEKLGYRLVDHRMELYGVALDRKS